MRFDYNTEGAHRGKFARVAVELDLRKPLISQVKIDGRLQNIEYEDLPMICYRCGRYGHISELCKNKQVVKETIQDTSVVVEVEKIDNSVSSTQQHPVSGL